MDAGVASAFDKRCARRAPVARVTCGRWAERKRKATWITPFLKRTWLLLGVLCACERAPREKKKKRRVVVVAAAAASSSHIYTSLHLLEEELLVVGFKKRNVTLSLVPSTVHNCCCCCCYSSRVCLSVSVFFFLETRTQKCAEKKKKNLIGRLCWAQCT